MGLLDKIKGAVTPNAHEGDAVVERGRDHTPAHPSHLNPAHADKERSESRGRGMVGTGRGGAGNMSRSRVRDADAEEPAEVVAEARSRSRSRTRAAHHGHDLAVPAGRGGAGNVRSPSRDPGSKERERKLDAEDKIVEEKYEEQHANDEHAAGRGGFGNITHAHGAKA